MKKPTFTESQSAIQCLEFTLKKLNELSRACAWAETHHKLFDRDVAFSMESRLDGVEMTLRGKLKRLRRT